MVLEYRLKLDLYNMFTHQLDQNRQNKPEYETAFIIMIIKY